MDNRSARNAPSVALLVDDLAAWVDLGYQPSGIQRVVTELLRTPTAAQIWPALSVARWRRVRLVETTMDRLRWRPPMPPATPKSRPRNPVVAILKVIVPAPIRAWLRERERQLKSVARGLPPPPSGKHADLVVLAGAFWADNPKAIARIVASMRTRVMVYDLIPLEQPQWFDDELRRVFADALDVVLPRAERIVVLSEAVAVAVARRYPAIESRIRVAVPTLAAHAPRHAATPAAPARPFLLAVGTVEARKNYPAILDAWTLALKDPRLADARLVICGRRGWGTEALEDRIAATPNVDRVALANDEDLERLYASASATVHASVAEGFGLPARESIVRGIPTLISSKIPHDGLAPGSFAVFDPADPEELARLMVDVLVEPFVRRPVDIGPGTGWEPVLESLVG